MQNPRWAFRPRVPQQSTGPPSGYWTEAPCRSPTPSQGNQTLGPPDSQTIRAECLHTAGSTHARTRLMSKVLTSV